MDTSDICIFCKKSCGEFPSIEHIIPESLGNTSDDLILSNKEVCVNCNNKLASKDSELVDRLQIFRVYSGVKNKKGNFASFTGTNFKMERRGEEISVEIKANDLPDGQNTNSEWNWKSNRKGDSITEIEDEVFIDNSVKIDHSYQMRFDQGISRALYKIAFEYLCIERGREYVLDSRWDKLRSYILGENSKPLQYIIIAPKNVNPYKIQISGGVGLVQLVSQPNIDFAVIRIEPLEFIVPLQEKGNSFLFKMYHEIRSFYNSTANIVANYSVAVQKNDGRVQGSFETIDETNLSRISRTIHLYSNFINDAALDEFFSSKGERVSISTILSIQKHLFEIVYGPYSYVRSFEESRKLTCIPDDQKALLLKAEERFVREIRTKKWSRLRKFLLNSPRRVTPDDISLGKEAFDKMYLFEQINTELIANVGYDPLSPARHLLNGL